MPPNQKKTPQKKKPSSTNSTAKTRSPKDSGTSIIEELLGKISAQNDAIENADADDLVIFYEVQAIRKRDGKKAEELVKLHGQLPFHRAFHADMRSTLPSEVEADMTRRVIRPISSNLQNYTSQEALDDAPPAALPETLSEGVSRKAAHNEQDTAEAYMREEEAAAKQED